MYYDHKRFVIIIARKKKNEFVRFELQWIIVQKNSSNRSKFKQKSSIRFVFDDKKLNEKYFLKHMIVWHNKNFEMQQYWIRKKINFIADVCSLNETREFYLNYDKKKNFVKQNDDTTFENDHIDIVSKLEINWEWFFQFKIFTISTLVRFKVFSIQCFFNSKFFQSIITIVLTVVTTKTFMTIIVVITITVIIITIITTIILIITLITIVTMCHDFNFDKFVDRAFSYEIHAFS